jgi:hypothetical protein
MASKTKGPEIVGKAKVAEMLGCHPDNMKPRGKWAYGLPPTLQERGLADTTATPLWYRDEIVALVKARNGA